MPYIPQDRRKDIGEVFTDEPLVGPGELNYAITKLIDVHVAEVHGGLCYDAVNEVIGALECAKLELYRRIAAPYEDVKLHENGEVYSVGNLRRSE